MSRCIKYQLPEFIIPAVTMKEVASHCVVFPISFVPEFVYVKLPAELVYDSDIVGFYEIGPMHQHGTLVPETATREELKPWLKIPSSSFGSDIGKQIYRITFQQRGTGRTFELYFSVNVQNDNPEKPYVYMKRDAQNV